MKVKVKYFALCREILGRSEEILELPEGARVKEILQRLEEEKPEISGLYETMRIAVNYEYVPEHTELHEGDEVALIPPVAGG